MKAEYEHLLFYKSVIQKYAQLKTPHNSKVLLLRQPENWKKKKRNMFLHPSFADLNSISSWKMKLGDAKPAEVKGYKLNSDNPRISWCSLVTSPLCHL